MKHNKRVHFYLNEVVIALVIALAIFIVNAIVISYTSISVKTSTILFVVLFVFISLVFIVVKVIVSSKKVEPLPEAMTVIANAVQCIDYPTVICNENEDYIIWYNQKAAELFGKKRVPFSNIFNIVEDNQCTDSFLLSAGNVYYKPISQTVTFNGQGYRVFIMDDVTFAENVNKELHDNDAAIAYITVDNLDEMLDYEQEDYRAASGSVETILRNWASQHNGFLKEYKQDRYIFVFSRFNIKEFTENSFNVLDSIHSVMIRGNIPVTVSIGISAGGTLLEREHQAQSALETALQRGGDQVVIKIEGNTEIFGGKIKTIQNRSSVRTRATANELLSLIKESSNVLIMAHRYADFDAIGSSVGIARIAMHCKKKVNIITDFSDRDLDKCRNILPSDVYNMVFVDTEDALELLTTNTLLVIVDVNNINQFENRAIAEKAKNIVVIDHHRKYTDETLQPKISYIEPSAAAASELVAEMLEYVLDDGELISYEASLLLAGIYLDTNQFKKDAGTRTFAASLYLRASGADVGVVQELFKTRLSDFQRELKFVSNVEIYKSIFAISSTEELCTLQDKIPAAKAADRLLTVDGVKASIAIVPIDGHIHVSARSSGDINVQLLLEKLKGGGHFDSAGAILKDMTVEKAIALIKNTINDYMNEI